MQSETHDIHKRMEILQIDYQDASRRASILSAANIQLKEDSMEKVLDPFSTFQSRIVQVLMVYEQSYPQLYNLVLMGFKRQVIGVLCPSHLLEVTLNHLTTLKVSIMQKNLMK